MKITKLLHIIAMSKDFRITEDERCFCVEHSKSNLVACIDKGNGKTSYYVSDCYNSPADWIDIKPSAFDELREFVSYLETEAGQ